MLAIVLLLAGVAAVVMLARHQRREPALPPAAEQPVRVVREVAARHGCPAEAVVAEEQDEPGGSLVVVTVHAPRRFPVERFSLDLQAAVHNLGGRLEPRPLGERGGYGLARLEGTVGTERWRVLVLGELARTTRRTSAPARTPRKEPTRAPSGGLPRLAVVLDDAGNSLEVCEQVRALAPEVAVAVLPNTPPSTEVARCLASQGRELLLHMPMQPEEEVGGGPGADAIEVGLASSEVQARLGRALERVPGVRGVNNHMGSLATTDVTTMEALAAALRPTGLYFLDSRTSPDTVAEVVMRDGGIPALRRDVFLDVVDEPAAIRRALAEAVELSEQQGHAVAIGHVHPSTIAALAAELPRLTPRITLVRPSLLAQAHGNRQ
ncbi:MAG: divergent polysaccharide deacetylase family protein [Thermoanaerobaculaceae bacterium]